MPRISPSGQPQAMPCWHTCTHGRIMRFTMVRFGYLPPVRAGTNTQTHTDANTQLAHMDPHWANPRDLWAPWWKIYAHTEGRRRGSGDRGVFKPPISFSQPDNSLPARTPCPPPLTPIISMHKQIPRQPGSLSRGEVREERNICVSSHNTGQMGVNPSDKATTHFLFHKVSKWGLLY